MKFIRNSGQQWTCHQLKRPKSEWGFISYLLPEHAFVLSPIYNFTSKEILLCTYYIVPSSVVSTLLMIIVPSIGKCFFFHKRSSDKIYNLKLYHLLNVTLHSKANVCNIGTLIRFYMQMRVEKKDKAFAYRFYRPLTEQCILTKATLCRD